MNTKEEATKDKYLELFEPVGDGQYRCKFMVKFDFYGLFNQTLECNAIVVDIHDHYARHFGGRNFLKECQECGLSTVKLKRHQKTHSQQRILANVLERISIKLKLKYQKQQLASVKSSEIVPIIKSSEIVPIVRSSKESVAKMKIRFSHFFLIFFSFSGSNEQFTFCQSFCDLIFSFF